MKSEKHDDQRVDSIEIEQEILMSRGSIDVNEPMDEAELQAWVDLYSGDGPVFPQAETADEVVSMEAWVDNSESYIEFFQDDLPPDESPEAVGSSPLMVWPGFTKAFALAFEIDSPKLNLTFAYAPAHTPNRQAPVMTIDDGGFIGTAFNNTHVEICPPGSYYLQADVHPQAATSILVTFVPVTTP